jgi:hypothetical protein
MRQAREMAIPPATFVDGFLWQDVRCTAAFCPPFEVISNVEVQLPGRWRNPPSYLIRGVVTGDSRDSITVGGVVVVPEFFCWSPSPPWMMIEKWP